MWKRGSEMQVISAPMKNGREWYVTLADILEPDAEPKDFLAPQAVAKRLSNS